jgi:hypothetical protein
MSEKPCHLNGQPEILCMIYSFGELLTVTQRSIIRGWLHLMILLSFDSTSDLQEEISFQQSASLRCLFLQLWMHTRECGSIMSLSNSGGARPKNELCQGREEEEAARKQFSVVKIKLRTAHDLIRQPWDRQQTQSMQEQCYSIMRNESIAYRRDFVVLPTVLGGPCDNLRRT